MEKIVVMMSGLPGKMATLIAKGILEDDRFELANFCLTGPTPPLFESPVPLFPPERREEVLGRKFDIAVDFTEPDAVNSNAEFYCQNDIPFVMGTTKGDRKALLETVERSSIPAVIAPNMAGPIVGFMDMIRYGAENYPGLFEGFHLKLSESHQEGKKGVSGTATALGKEFNKLGAVNQEGEPFNEGDITSIRDKKFQRDVLGVPEDDLDGHGWHTSELTSSDGTVVLRFTHNVNGRELYVPCTLKAILFLHQKVQEGATGVFSMYDVLRG